ncbi:MAG TPA: hypothetical protein VN696_13575 [Pyrinomonadaceae bacterium]|nr:hypothetical protein [Pyrinomonadaceae bacterium]
MARGWESKSVEDQVAAAEAAKEARAKPFMTAEQRAKETERQSLLLSRAQTINRLKQATNPRYRTQLESALQALEDRLRRLDHEK